jgi:two-component system LytT family response regulator/two-component system response regulator LytT
VRALVVDDEPLVRGELVFALGRVAEDILVEEAEDATAALARLAAERFDAVFLDIAMPGMNGLDALRVINRLPHRPHVVFVTAYDAHAIKAFELAATDYLVKPVGEERLAATVARIRAQRPPGEAPAPAADRIPLEFEDRTMLIRIADIRFVQANGHLVTAATGEREMRFRGSLAECAARLEPHGFLRVHRSYLVNPKHVLEITPFFSGTYTLRVDNRAHSEVPVSRGFMPAVRRAFGL